METNTLKPEVSETGMFDNIKMFVLHIKTDSQAVS
jgi:hypothetical protein